MASQVTEFSYMGKQITITEDHPEAVINIDGREFRCHHHHADTGMGMWMCPEAYFGSPDIREVARHFADYGYLYDAPGRVIVNDKGEVVERGEGHDHGNDHPHGQVESRRARRKK